eukprot:scaffold33302_cov129-Isochrysis_galbana.AAC.4
MSVRVWTIDESGRGTDVEFKGHTDSVDQLRWDPRNPDLLGTASGDKTVRPPPSVHAPAAVATSSMREERR